MLAWTDVACAYAGYLTALAWLVPRFRSARVASVTALALLGLVWWTSPRLDAAAGAGAALKWIVVPSLALIASYRLSGAFFVKPSARLERRLLAADDVLLARGALLRLYRTAPRLVADLVELLYLLVYAVVPAGAAVLLAGGHGEDALDSYWTTVFLSELICYALLPWLQSRPPRAIEPQIPAPAPGPIRRLNLWLLRHGSIQVNTVPSAHAAGALAVGLAVYSTTPEAGVVFIAVGVGIAVATVLGRYHYALDSMLGVGVAVAVWVALGA